MCSAFAGSYGLAATALRFTNVYGPFSYHKGSVVASFMKRIMDGDPLVVYGDGSQTRDFLFVDDLCRAVIAVLDRRPIGELYQLGTGTETSVTELVEQLVAIFPDREVEVRHEPARAGEIARSFSDISRARDALGLSAVGRAGRRSPRHARLVRQRAESMRIRADAWSQASLRSCSSGWWWSCGRSGNGVARWTGSSATSCGPERSRPSTPTSASSSGRPEIAIVIAAYNEEDAIAGVLDALPTELCGHGVTPIVVVDGGTDDTAGVVTRAGYIAVQPRAQSRARAMRCAPGSRSRSNAGASIVVTMDADGQHRPEELPRLIGPILERRGRLRAGIAVPRRLRRLRRRAGPRHPRLHDADQHDQRGRGSPTARTASGRSAAMRSRALQLQEPRFSAAELIMESARRDLRIREVPVHIQTRSHGESKKPRRLGYPIGYLGTIVRTWRR